METQLRAPSLLLCLTLSSAAPGKIPLQGQLANVEQRKNRAGGGFETSRETGIFINTPGGDRGGQEEKKTSKFPVGAELSLSTAAP